jgi:hypothetical protein
VQKDTLFMRVFLPFCIKMLLIFRRFLR